MKKIILLLTLLFCNCSFASIHVGSFSFNTFDPFWQVRISYPGIFCTDTGYFYLDHWSHDVTIYCSDRNTECENLDGFCDSLNPLEENLLPYASPNWKSNAESQLLSIEDTTFRNMPAKKLEFEVYYPKSESSERVISYIFLKERKGIFYNTLVGYTLSLACKVENFEENQNLIQSIMDMTRFN